MSDSSVNFEGACRSDFESLKDSVSSDIAKLTKNMDERFAQLIEAVESLPAEITMPGGRPPEGVRERREARRLDNT